jgi:hypothetical protein
VDFFVINEKITILFYETIVPFVLLFSATFTAVYYTEDFKELSTAEGAAYYST